MDSFFLLFFSSFQRRTLFPSPRAEVELLVRQQLDGPLNRVLSLLVDRLLGKSEVPRLFLSCLAQNDEETMPPRNLTCFLPL